MKRLFYLIIGALCIIVASCSKDSGFFPGSDHAMAFSKGFPAHVFVIPYTPAADGDDTDELLAVISGAAPGSVIKLAPGDYYLKAMEILGFNGTIMGSGTNKTFINVVGPIDQNADFERNLMPCWIRIIGGNVVLSDLTFKSGDGSLVMEPDSWYDETLISMIVVNNYDNDYGLAEKPPMDFTMKNVNFLCGSMESVIDNGTNNTIVGMKKRPGHTGPSIRDNFRMWHHGRRH